MAEISACDTVTSETFEQDIVSLVNIKAVDIKVNLWTAFRSSCRSLVTFFLDAAKCRKNAGKNVSEATFTVRLKLPSLNRPPPPPSSEHVTSYLMQTGF